ncbi:hypothetical protein [Nocardia xishanensis]
MSVTYDHYPELHRLVEQLPPESAPEARAVLVIRRVVNHRRA